MAEPEPGRRPTIADIARLAGVSKGAVSYALNDRPGVSDATRVRVREIASELGWVPNPAARVLSGARADAVGLVLSRAARSLGIDTFFLDFLAGLQSELAGRGVALLLQLVPDHDEAVRVLRRWWAERRVDGVLIMDMRDHDPRLAAVREVGLPALVVGGPDGAAPLPCLWSDDAGAMAAAVGYLAALGHRRIARVAGPPQLRHTMVRTASFHAEAARLGLTETTVITPDPSDPVGVQVTRTLLCTAPRPSAIIYDTDVTAAAGLTVVNEMGLSVPADVSLLAWDDSPLCGLTRPALSAMSRDVTGFGVHAGRLLLDVVSGDQVGSVPSRSAVLTPRGSTAPPPP
jgi:DNA-binding LacI/PurR family transcriptional regulator